MVLFIPVIRSPAGLRLLFKTWRCPLVLVATSCQEAGLPSVVIDNEVAAYEAVSFLIQRGRKKIAMISGPLEEPNAGRTRVRGYRKALSANGLSVWPQHLCTGGYRM